MKRLLIFLLAVFPLIASAQKTFDLDLPHNRSTTYTLDTLFLDHDSTYITADTDSMKFVVDDAEALRLVNEGASSTVNVYGDLTVTGTTTTADAIITNLATPTTTVLTPTSTGLIDILETTDLATADMTVTGDWVMDTVYFTNITVDGGYNFAADAQADDDYEISLPTITALTTGMMVTFIANTANTDGATLEITEVGDLDAILKMHDTVLASGDIEAGQVVVVVFDGSNWQMISQIAQ